MAEEIKLTTLEEALCNFFNICDVLPDQGNKLATALTSKYNGGKTEEIFDDNQLLLDQKLNNKNSIYFQTIRMCKKLIKFKKMIKNTTQEDVKEKLGELIKLNRDNEELKNLEKLINNEKKESIEEGKRSVDDIKKIINDNIQLFDNHLFDNLIKFNNQKTTYILYQQKIDDFLKELIVKGENLENKTNLKNLMGEIRELTDTNFGLYH